MNVMFSVNTHGCPGMHPLRLLGGFDTCESSKRGYFFGPQGPGDSSDVIERSSYGVRWIGMMRDSQGERVWAPVLGVLLFLVDYEAP